MSLTEAETVFAGLHEDGLNDILTAFFMARGHHLNYGTSLFVPATTASATNMAPISFPGIPTGIHWAVSFSIPRVDLFDESSGQLPGELSLGAGQFSLHTSATLTLACLERIHDPHQERPDFRSHPIRAKLDVWAVGHPVVFNFGGGNGLIGLAVDAVEIVDVSPEKLESLLECLVLMLLQAALSDVRLPFQALRAGAFELILQRGPEIEDDLIKLYGTT